MAVVRSTVRGTRRSGARGRLETERTLDDETGVTTENVYTVDSCGTRTLFTRRTLAPADARGWSRSEARRRAIRNRVATDPPKAPRTRAPGEPFDDSPEAIERRLRAEWNAKLAALGEPVLPDHRGREAHANRFIPKQRKRR